jgi:hypothetical protein
MPLLLEHWKPIVGFESLYAISNVGNVRRIRCGSRTQANKILRNLPNSKGYIVLTLCVDGVRYKRAVHRLVAEHFNGVCPDGLQVNHENGWKAKNWASNLEYATPKANIQHAWHAGLCGEAVLSPEQVEEVKRLHGIITQKEMANRYGVTLNQIKNIFRTRTKLRHVAA